MVCGRTDPNTAFSRSVSKRSHPQSRIVFRSSSRLKLPSDRCSTCTSCPVETSRLARCEPVKTAPPGDKNSLKSHLGFKQIETYRKAESRFQPDLLKARWRSLVDCKGKRFREDVARIMCFRDRVGSSVAGGRITDVTQRGRASCKFWPQRGYLLLDGRRVCSFIWLARDSRKSLDSRNISPMGGADKF